MLQSLLKPTYVVGRLWDGIRGAYSDINPATLTGAIDVIVVKQKDGSYQCGPFHVRFGKMGALRPNDLLVDICINGKHVEDLHMRLGSAGEAFFVEELTENEDVPEESRYHPFANKRSMSTSEIISLETSSNLRMSRDPSIKVCASTKAKDIPNSAVRKRREMAIAARCRSVDSTPVGYSDRDLELDEGAVSDSEIESHYDKTFLIGTPPDIRTSNDMQVPGLVTCLSDSLLHKSDTSGNYLPNRPNAMNLSWDWGNFPSEIPPYASNHQTDATNSQNDLQKSSTENTSQNEPILSMLHVSTNLDDVPLQASQSGNSNRATAPEYSDNGGIYLQDLIESKTDEELKKAYIYSHGAESPRGTFKDQLTRFNSLETLSQQQDAGYRSDGDMWSFSPVPNTPPYPTVHHMRLSLCGNLTQDSRPSQEHFLEHLVSYEEFVKDPERILADSNLVLQFNERYLPWAVVAPMLVSIIGYQTELSHSVTKRLEEQHIPKPRTRRKTWFSWGASKSPEPSVAAIVNDGTLSKEVTSSNVTGATGVDPSLIKDSSQPPSALEPSVTTEDGEEVVLRVEQDSKTEAPDSILKYTKCYKKVNRLSSEKIKKLNLNEGYNEIEYRIITRWQGTATCKAAIYLWNWYDSVVISDVDGTITRSDVLGHVFPFLGRDWTQIGIAKFYHKIAQNGYRFVYLSARAIGQSEPTRRYLTSLVQEEKMQLPRGPILLSPNSLLHAFHQEVIERKPEKFKIQCLQDLRLLFPSHLNPFFAGFGNRPSDVRTYLTVGIPDCRIFTVDYLGTLYNERTHSRKTNFRQLTELVDFVFSARSGREPRIDSIMFDDEVDTLQYSSYCFWREPIPSLEGIL